MMQKTQTLFNLIIYLMISMLFYMIYLFPEKKKRRFKRILTRFNEKKTNFNAFQRIENELKRNETGLKPV